MAQLFILFAAVAFSGQKPINCLVDSCSQALKTWDAFNFRMVAVLRARAFCWERVKSADEHLSGH